MRLSLPRLKMPRLPGFSILVWISTALKGWVMGSREKDSYNYDKQYSLG